MDVIALLNKCTEDSGEAPHLSERMIMPVGNECVLCFRKNDPRSKEKFLETQALP